MSSTIARGSTGNVVSALASFVLPGLGQLLQGRLLAAGGFLLLSGAIWVLTLGTLAILGHIVAALEAAIWRDKTLPGSR